MWATVLLGISVLLAGVVVIVAARIVPKRSGISGGRDRLLLMLDLPAACGLVACGVTAGMLIGHWRVAGGAGGVGVGRASLWPAVGLPVAGGMLAAAMGLMGAAPRQRRFDGFWIGSVLIGGAVTLMLVLADRIRLFDALLVFVALTAWAWVVTSGAEASAASAKPQAAEGDDATVDPDGGAVIALMFALAAALGGSLAMGGSLTHASLVALVAITGVSFAAVRRPGDRQSEDRVTPITPGLVATIGPLSALVCATVTHVVLIAWSSAAEAEASGLTWMIGAAEALLAGPYLSGVGAQAHAAILALTLPFLQVALDDVGRGVRLGAGVVMVLVALVLVARGLGTIG